MMNNPTRVQSIMVRELLATGGLLLGVLGTACAGIRAAPTVPAEPPSLQFEHVRYDGHSLSGLVLIGARAPFVLDRRLAAYVNVGISNLRDCSTGQQLPSLAADFGQPAMQGHDLLPLGAGEWFGRELHFILFTDPFDPPVGPACIDFELSFSIPGAQGPVATLQGRVSQADADPASPEIPAEGAKDVSGDDETSRGKCHSRAFRAGVGSRCRQSALAVMPVW